MIGQVSANAPVRVGETEYQDPVAYDFATPSHIALAGATRSGKSALAYWLLGQLAAMPWVRIVGSDVSSLLLHPFAGDPLVALGQDDLDAHARALEGVEKLMRDRLDRLLAERRDKIDEFTVACPLVLVVIEEFPSLLELAKTLDASTSPKGRLEARLRSVFLRLVTQSAKCGIRVMVVAQRMDASILQGVARSNIETRFLLRSDEAGIEMMIPGWMTNSARSSPGPGPASAIWACPAWTVRSCSVGSMCPTSSIWIRRRRAWPCRPRRFPWRIRDMGRACGGRGRRAAKAAEPDPAPGPARGRGAWPSVTQALLCLCLSIPLVPDCRLF